MLVWKKLSVPSVRAAGRWDARLILFVVSNVQDDLDNLLKQVISWII